MARRPEPMVPLAVDASNASRDSDEFQGVRLVKLCELPAARQARVRARLARFWLYVEQVRDFEAHVEEELL